MKDFPALRRLTRVFVGMAVIGVCLMVAGIAIAIWVRGSETPVAATIMIGIGAVMVLLGIRAVVKGQRMIRELSRGHHGADAGA